MFHKNNLDSIRRSTFTVFYSLLYLNSRKGFNGLKYMYSVISAIVFSLAGNTKNRESTRSWTARVRWVDAWAVSQSCHALASFHHSLGCTLLQHPTSPALLTSPTPCQRVLVCGACIGTAQVGSSFFAPLEFIFRRSSLRSFRDMIIISWIYTLLLTTSRWKV